MQLGFAYRPLGQYADTARTGELNLDDIAGDKHILHAQHPCLHSHSFAVEEQMPEIIEQIAFSVQLEGFDPVAGRQGGNEAARPGHIRADQLAFAVHTLDIHQPVGAA
ncbi:hypothetical protein D3C74_373160 [compost metagenome]